MAEPTPLDIKLAMARNVEVVEAITARRGDLYSTRVQTYVACMKLLKIATQDDPPGAFAFARMLIECFAIPEAEVPEFINDATSISKAQIIK